MPSARLRTALLPLRTNTCEPLTVRDRDMGTSPTSARWSGMFQSISTRAFCSTTCSPCTQAQVAKAKITDRALKPMLRVKAERSQGRRAPGSGTLSQRCFQSTSDNA